MKQKYKLLILGIFLIAFMGMSVSPGTAADGAVGTIDCADTVSDGQYVCIKFEGLTAGADYGWQYADTSIANITLGTSQTTWTVWYTFDENDATGGLIEVALVKKALQTDIATHMVTIGDSDAMMQPDMLLGFVGPLILIGIVIMVVRYVFKIRF